MDERQQITFMQARIERMAYHRWSMSLKEVVELCSLCDVLGYVERNFRLFHMEGDDAVFDDVEAFMKYKGFGRGFYLTSPYEQAASFACLSLRKAKENGVVPKEQDCGWVTSLVVRGMVESRVEVLVFPTANIGWLRCIAAHRRSGAFPDVLRTLAAYDVIVGRSQTTRRTTRSLLVVLVTKNALVR